VSLGQYQNFYNRVNGVNSAGAAMSLPSDNDKEGELPADLAGAIQSAPLRVEVSKYENGSAGQQLNPHIGQERQLQ
jgi:hypothetical protein